MFEENTEICTKTLSEWFNKASTIGQFRQILEVLQGLYD